MSASRKAGSLVTLKPVLAMETVKRFFRLKRLFVQITSLSQRKVHFFCQSLPTGITCSDWLSLCRTSIFTSVPAVWSDSIRRLAAMAAPPVFSDVLIISTLMLRNVLAKVQLLPLYIHKFAVFLANKGESIYLCRGSFIII